MLYASGMVPTPQRAALAAAMLSRLTTNSRPGDHMLQTTVPAGSEVRFVCRTLSLYQMADLAGLIQKGRVPLANEAKGILADLLVQVYDKTWDEFENLCAATARFGTLTAERVYRNLGKAQESLVAEYLQRKVGCNDPTYQVDTVVGVAGQPDRARGVVRPQPRKLNPGARLRWLVKPDDVTKPGNGNNVRMKATPDGSTLALIWATPGAMNKADIPWALDKGYIRLEE